MSSRLGKSVRGVGPCGRKRGVVYPCQAEGCDGSYTVTKFPRSFLCRSCSMREINDRPEVAAARAERMRKLWSDDLFRLRRSQAIGRGQRARLEDPAEMEKARENGRRAGLQFGFGHLVDNEKMKAARKEIGRKRTERLIGWCPPEFLDEYVILRDRKFGNARDARAAIIGLIRTLVGRVRSGVITDPVEVAKVERARAHLKKHWRL